MYKYTDAFTNRSGDALPGYFARLYDSDSNQVDLFADANGTPISTVSGVANAALSDENGMFRWFVANGTYDIRFYDSNDVFVAPAEIGVPMIDASGVYTDLSGDDGATLVGTPTGTVQGDIDAANAGLAARPTTADLASPTGGEMVGFSHDAPNTGDTIGQRLAQEIWVTDAPYNADPTGVADASAAFQAALDALEALGGGTLRGKGVFKINATLAWPAEPATINFRGEGLASTKLVQGTADTPIITKVAGVSRVVGADVIGFTVVAHAASDKTDPTNILINIAGFDDSTFRIGYESDPAATSTMGCAYAVIAGHANPVSCYKNKIIVKAHHRIVAGDPVTTYGPEKIVWLHNGGGTTDNNANCNEVSVWAYGLTAMGSAIDGGDTTQMVVKFSIIEDCPGATGIVGGNFMLTRNNWIENVAVSIYYGVTSDTTANNCVSFHDQFSGTNKIVIHSSIAGPPRFNDPLFGTMTFENQSAAPTTNYVMPTVAKATPSTPTISWLLIGVTLVSTDVLEVRLRPDHHGVVTTTATYTVTPLGTGREALSITPPAGYEIMNASVGIEEIGVGVRPVALASDAAGKNYVVYWPNTNNHQVNVRVTMRAV